MRILTAALITSAVLLTGCNKSADKPKEAKTGSDGNPITAPLDYLAAEAAAKRTSERVANMAPITTAIQQFRASEDRFPRDLNELMKSGYIGRIPEAPPGQVYWYNPNTGELKVVPISAVSVPGPAAQRPMPPANTIQGFKQRLPQGQQIPNE